MDISEKIDNTVDDDTYGNDDECIHFILFHSLRKWFQLIPKKNGLAVRKRWIK